MYNPLEIRVALNATTNQGLLAHQELAGQQYRQLQELKDTHRESLVRDSRIKETPTDQATDFQRVENPGDDSPRKEELWQRHQERRQQAEEQSYAPIPARVNSQPRRTLVSETGSIINLQL
ncbi:MAG: hypothetical protein KDK39_14815 [Leptospiraceae bacterium]|nr:hypothetical protein [Leptospiraceae bacterium]